MAKEIVVQHGPIVAWHTVLRMVDSFFAMLPNLLIACVVFTAFHLLGRLSRRVVAAMAHTARMDNTLAQALSRLAAVFTNILGLLVCAVIIVPTFSPGQLITGLGITSVAIGFAFQNILQNFFAGLLLLWQKPFGIGDEIKTKDFEGTVEDITIRTTLLRTYAGERVYIPNGILFTDPVTVKTAHATRRAHIEVPLKAANAKEARDAALTALASMPEVSKNPPPEVFVTAAKDPPTLDVYFWTESKHESLVKATADSTVAISTALSKLTADKDREQNKTAA